MNKSMNASADMGEKGTKERVRKGERVRNEFKQHGQPLSTEGRVRIVVSARKMRRSRLCADH